MCVGKGEERGRGLLYTKIPFSLGGGGEIVLDAFWSGFLWIPVESFGLTKIGYGF